MFRFLALTSAIIVCAVFSGKAYNEKVIDSGKLLQEGYQKLYDGDTTAAMALFEQIHRNDTNYNDASFQRIIVLNAQEKYDKAMKLVKEGLAAPSEDEYRFLLLKGNILKSKEQYESALKVLEGALEKYPYNHYLLLSAALTHKELENYDEYITYLKNTVYTYPFFASVHFELGHIAREENRISQALMSYIMGVLLEPNSDRSRAVLLIMNNMVTDKLEVEDTSYEFPENQDDYSDIDNIIKNYVALQDEYKVKSKADLPLIRQLQVLMETLDYDESDEGFWMQFYVNFYKKLWEEKMFEKFSYYILRPSTLDEHVKLVRKKQSDISAFSIWAGKTIKSYFETIPIEIEGKMIAAPRSYFGGDETGFYGIGETEYGIKKGCWYYFHTSGTIQSKGCYDDAGYLTGKWEWYNAFGQLDRVAEVEKSKYEGLYTNYTRLGTPLTEIEFKDGQRNGKYKEYYELGGVYSEGTYKDDKLNGDVMVYYENGNLKFKYQTKDGKLDGLLREYFVTGKLSKITKYKDGVKDSVMTAYFSNGQLKSKYEYADSKLHGAYVEYYMDGTLSREGKYEDGNLVGEHKEYFSNGKIEQITTYDTEGKENGMLTEYDEDGIKYQELDYKKGNIYAFRIYNKAGEIVKEDVKKGGTFEYSSLKPDGAQGSIGTYDVKGGKDGEWKFYDKNGVLSEVAMYNEGYLDGQREKYYPNGELRSTSSYEKGYWQGVYKEFYSNGKISEEGYGKDGDTHGPYYEFSVKGDTLEDHYFSYDNRVGWQLDYGVNGKLKQKLRYDYNRLIAEYKVDSTGKVYDSLNYVNKNGKGVLHHLNGKVYFEGEFKNGRKTGKSVWYHGNGNVSQEGNYINDVRHGEFKRYHENGELADVYNYQLGTRHGKVVWYHKNGKIKDTHTYNYGSLNGESLSYYDTGKIKEKMNYVMGSLHGKRYFYDPEGIVEHIRHYFYGKIIGYSYIGKDGKEVEMIPIEPENAEVKSFFENGNQGRVYTLVNGDFDGPYIKYYASGQIYQEMKYVDDNIEGEHRAYYPNGQLESITNYTYDKWDGKYTNYHKNGKVKEECNYLLGKKHGTWKTYDSNGKLIETKVYYLDLLYETK